MKFSIDFYVSTYPIVPYISLCVQSVLDIALATYFFQRRMRDNANLNASQSEEGNSKDIDLLNKSAKTKYMVA